MKRISTRCTQCACKTHGEVNCKDDGLYHYSTGSGGSVSDACKCKDLAASIEVIRWSCMHMGVGMIKDQDL